MEFETIWDPNADAEQKKLLKKRDYIRSLCTKITLSCDVRNGECGIWLIGRNRDYLLNPMEVVNSLLDDEHLLTITTISKIGEHKVVPDKIVFHSSIKDFCISWELENMDNPKIETQLFKKEEYVEQVTSVITELNEAVTIGKPLVYDKIDFDEESLKVCFLQLLHREILPSDYALMSSQVKPEKFLFNVLSDKYGAYTIGIVNRHYETFITLLNSDFEIIRHQIETYCLDYKTDVHLTFDYVDEIVNLQEVSIYDKIEKVSMAHVIRINIL